MRRSQSRRSRIMAWIISLVVVVSMGLSLALTLVPTRLYFSGAHAKVELALARGKERRDKREVIREREQRRDMERALKERSR